MICNRRTVAAVLLIVATGTVADAQLIGARQMGIGQTLARGTNQAQFSGSQGQFSTAGQLQGSARYLRGNRSRNSFVGSDQADQQGFVGNTQARATGTVASSIAGLKDPPDQTQQINQPIPPLGAKGMYHPVYRLDWPADTPAVSSAPARLSKALSNSPHWSRLNRVEVSLEGRTAILRGEVTSAKERTLAERVALLEPGISAVRNELRVQESLTIPAPPLPGQD